MEVLDYRENKVCKYNTVVCYNELPRSPLEEERGKGELKFLRRSKKGQTHAFT